MATSAKVLTMVALDPLIKQTVDIVVEESCLAEFGEEKVFHRKFCMLQKGSNPLPYYGGNTNCKLYTLKEVEDALRSLSPQPMMIQDVPTP